MWIFLKDAFLSIVDKGGDGTTLLVRARRREDIVRLFPGAAVSETPHHDYRFRARIDRETVASRIAEEIRGIRYGNFKATVAERDRHDSYTKVWSTMLKLQRQ